MQQAVAREYRSILVRACFVGGGIPGEECHKPANAVDLGFYLIVFEIASQGWVVILNHDGNHFENDF